MPVLIAIARAAGYDHYRRVAAELHVDDRCAAKFHPGDRCAYFDRAPASINYDLRAAEHSRSDNLAGDGWR